MSTNLPKTIYHLILQDENRDGAVIADIVSASPFPRLMSGDQIIVEHTQPRCWDVSVSITKVEYSLDRTELHVSSCLVVQSPSERGSVEE